MFFYKNAYLLLFAILLILGSIGCGEGGQSKRQSDSIAARQAYRDAPPLSPEEALKHFKIDEGFSIKIVAAEPLVQAPVVAVFDEKGRIWVVEMAGYMPDTAGSNETVNPSGKIVILEDHDHDGVM